ncbi:UNKNOWN [Stylonychia lemnae]|uniref:Uncharacterized protein n=1 Tax=Stylonychia lemnae TaxID=5949 RepID=A0A078B6S3_STYLE|nr:UNKNOWN [Stylonychia lemnae]|eukprot:CDW88992.1 UNKNOWN [Stylonychia lemnae]
MDAQFYCQTQNQDPFYFQKQQLQQRSLDQEILDSFMQRLQCPLDVDFNFSLLQKVQHSIFNNKQNQLIENLKSYFKDQNEALFEQIQIQEWDNQKLQDSLMNINRRQLMRAQQLVREGMEEEAFHIACQVNDRMSKAFSNAQTILEELYGKIRNAVKYSVQSISSQIIKDSSMTELLTVRPTQQIIKIDQQHFNKDPQFLNDSNQNQFNAQLVNQDSLMMDQQDEFGIQSVKDLQMNSNNQGYNFQVKVEQEKIGHSINSQSETKIDFLNKKFQGHFRQQSQQSLLTLNGFEEADQFIKNNLICYQNFSIVSTQNFNINQIFVLTQNQSQGDIRVQSVKLINCETSNVKFLFTQIDRHFLMITVSLHITTIKIRNILVDSRIGQIISKKDQLSPNPSGFKCYYSQPYFCMLFNMAKLLVVDIQEIIRNPQQNQIEFNEVQTMINIQSINQSILFTNLSGKEPTELIGFLLDKQKMQTELQEFTIEYMGRQSIRIFMLLTIDQFQFSVGIMKNQMSSQIIRIEYQLSMKICNF